VYELKTCNNTKHTRRYFVIIAAPVAVAILAVLLVIVIIVLGAVTEHEVHHLKQQ